MSELRSQIKALASYIESNTDLIISECIHTEIGIRTPKSRIPYDQTLDFEVYIMDVLIDTESFGSVFDDKILFTDYQEILLNALENKDFYTKCVKLNLVSDRDALAPNKFKAYINSGTIKGVEEFLITTLI